MESQATLATRNPCLLASPRVEAGLGTARLPGFQRRMRGARLVATGAFGRRSVSVESKLSCELGEGGVGATACGDRWRKNALARIYGFGDFGVITLAMRAFKKKFSSIEGFIGEDHEDGDDEEEEGGGGGGGSRGSDDDDDDDDDEEDTTDDEDEEEDTTDEEDTTEDEDEDEDEDDQEDEGECDD